MLDDAGDLISGVADMDIGQAALYPTARYSDLTALLEDDRPAMVVFDGNIGPAQARELLSACEAYTRNNSQAEEQQLYTLFEPTSVSKSTVILSHFASGSATKRKAISFATPNAVELEQIHTAALELGLLRSTSKDTSLAISKCFRASSARRRSPKGSALVEAGIFSTILLKVGRHGVITIDAKRIYHHPIPAGQVTVVNTTGCGDSFAGAFTATFSHRLKQRSEEVKEVVEGSEQWYSILDEAVEVGQLAARQTLASNQAVGEGMHLLLQDRK